MPPATRAFTTTFSTWRADGGPGAASSPAWTRRSCSRACWRPRPTFRETRRTKRRSAGLRTPCTEKPTGNGCRTGRPRSVTAGSLNEAFYAIVGRDTTRRSCSTCSGSDRLAFRCPLRATKRGFPRTSGKRSTASSSSTPGHCSSTSFRTCGSTSAAFATSSCASLVQQQYGIRNPHEFEHYDEFCWGITSSDGPGPRTLRVDGIERVLYDYVARGAPYGPDDGTLAPWAVVASLPFAPEIVLPTLQYCAEKYHEENDYGLVCSINPTFPDGGRASPGWISDEHFALD